MVWTIVRFLYGCFSHYLKITQHWFHVYSRHKHFSPEAVHTVYNYMHASCSQKSYVYSCFPYCLRCPASISLLARLCWQRLTFTGVQIILHNCHFCCTHSVRVQAAFLSCLALPRLVSSYSQISPRLVARTSLNKLLCARVQLTWKHWLMLGFSIICHFMMSTSSLEQSGLHWRKAVMSYLNASETLHAVHSFLWWWKFRRALLKTEKQKEGHYHSILHKRKQHFNKYHGPLTKHMSSLFHCLGRV